MVEKDFDCISTYRIKGEKIFKIREKKYLNNRIVFEQSHQPMEDEYLFFDDKIHDFDYSKPNEIKEIIKEINASDEDYVTRKFDKKGRLIFEQNSSNYDQPGYEKLFFYKDDADELLKLELWYYGRTKYFELNFAWEEQHLKSIERIHFKSENRFSKEYIFFKYNKLEQLEKVCLELNGISGEIEFKYEGELLIEKHKTYNYSGIKVGKALEYNFYVPNKGIQNIISAEYFDGKFVKGEKYFIREEIIESKLKEEDGKKEKIITVEIDLKHESIKEKNDLQEHLRSLRLFPK